MNTENHSLLDDAEIHSNAASPAHASFTLCAPHSTLPSTPVLCAEAAATPCVPAEATPQVFAFSSAKTPAVKHDAILYCAPANVYPPPPEFTDIDYENHGMPRNYEPLRIYRKQAAEIFSHLPWFHESTPFWYDLAIVVFTYDNPRVPGKYLFKVNLNLTPRGDNEFKHMYPNAESQDCLRSCVFNVLRPRCTQQAKMGAAAKTSGKRREAEKNQTGIWRLFSRVQ